MSTALSWLPPAFLEHLRASDIDILYHYTGQDGLISIAQTGNLWASKVQYMNDSTEFTRSIQVVNEELEASLQRSRAELVTRRKAMAAVNQEMTKVVERLERLRASVEGIENINIFASCFCEDPDLLSQWRGYSGDSYGYSIGFGSTVLRDAGQKHKFWLGKCIYDTSLQRQIIAEAVQECQWGDQSPEEPRLSEILFVCGALFKDPTFAQEREWRLILSVTAATGFRRGASMLIPYYELPIRTSSSAFIRRVYVGPCPHKDLSKAAVELLLLNSHAGVLVPGRGIGGSPDVRVSAIPFRNW